MGLLIGVSSKMNSSLVRTKGRSVPVVRICLVGEIELPESLPIEKDSQNDFASFQFK